VVRHFQVEGYALRQVGRCLPFRRRFETGQNVDHGELDRLDVDDDAGVLDDAGVVAFDDGHPNVTSASNLREKFEIQPRLTNIFIARQSNSKSCQEVTGLTDFKLVVRTALQMVKIALI
jgi:hypothetical protein